MGQQNDRAMNGKELPEGTAHPETASQDHNGTNELTPGATAQEKKERIRHHFSQIMNTLGLDLDDDSLRDTPSRVARMYVDELFRGLDPAQRPRVKTFDNKYQYKEMLLERDITVHSHCEHHFLPVIGRAHVAYIPNERVVGLSKLNRIVDYYSRRPQVQERLTVQIADELMSSLKTEDVAIMIEAEHHCVKLRGVEDIPSLTTTYAFRGKFEERKWEERFLNACLR